MHGPNTGPIGRVPGGEKVSLLDKGKSTAGGEIGVGCVR